MTDAQVFFRAGWAVWANVSPYSVPDDNGWQFLYTPAFAIVMVPFANPPPGGAVPWFSLPYPVAIAIWYVLGVAALAWSLTLAARAAEKAIFPKSSSPISVDNVFWQPWWNLRTAPFIAYMLVIGSGLGRGQVTTIILLTIVGFGTLLVSGKSFWAGLVLSAGVAIKIFPIIGLGVPILRRDFACIAGFSVGCLLLLVVLPFAVLGHEGMLATYNTFATRLFDLTNFNFSQGYRIITPDMIGFGAVVYKYWVTFGIANPPRIPPDWIKFAHVGFLAVFLLVFVVSGYGKFWRFKGSQPDNPAALILAVAVLAALMAPASFVAQFHYVTLCVFLYALFVAMAWRKSGRASTPLWLYGLGVSIWVASAFNLEEHVGWLSTSLFPVILSIVIGLFALRRQV